MIFGRKPHIRDAVARYATRYHRLLAGEHGVASPYGAWLLLALVALSATGEARRELADVLGCDVDTAFAAASDMLADPHAELVLGSALWHDERFETDALLELLRRLSPPADSGPIPTQQQADAWARERTAGLIERFPITIDGAYPIVLLLATAIATKVSWQTPFVLAGPSSLALPADPRFADMDVLRDPGASQWQGFVDTEAGLVAGFSARSEGGLLVTSVAADAGADPAIVLDAATKIAIGVASGSYPTVVPLAELPLGDGAAWRITEAWMAGFGGGERYEVVLPAWEAHSDHNLLADPSLGFAVAGRAIIELLPPGEDYAAEAKQSAVARYTREGFEAAAVTAIAARLTSAAPAQRLVRTARIEFTRPHAVVATTQGFGHWDGMPLFAAWVAEGTPAG